MQFRSVSLCNGLRVNTAHSPDAKTAAIHAAVRSGGLYEDRKHRGVSHLLEHLHALSLVGDGTAENCGNARIRLRGQFDAWMDNDATHYSVSCNQSECVQTCVAVVSSLLAQVKITESALLREKRVLADEVGRCGHDVTSALYSRLFPRHALSSPTGGEPSRLRALSMSAVSEYDNKFYNPGNIAIGIAGAIDKGMLADLAARLSSLEGIGGAGERVNCLPTVQPIVGRLVTWQQLSGECAAVFAIPPNTSYEDILSLRIVAAGASMPTSPFFKALRYGRPAHYEFEFGLEYPNEWTLFIVRCKAKWSQQRQALKRIVATIAGLQGQAGNHVNGSCDLWLEEAVDRFTHMVSDDVMPYNARAFQLACPLVSCSSKRYSRASEELCMTADITPNAIRRACRELLKPGRMVAMLDPPRLLGMYGLR